MQIKNKYPARHGDASLYSPSTRGSRDREIKRQRPGYRASSRPAYYSSQILLKKKKNAKRGGWLLLAIPALSSLRQKDHHRFKAILGYRVRLNL